MIYKAKALVHRLRGSSDGRVLASNFSYLVILQGAGYVFPLITIPYLARVVGVTGIGKISFAAAIVVWFKTVTDWGFNYTATRDVARHREDAEKVSEIFSYVLWSRLFLMLLSLIFLLLAITAVPYLKENRVVLLASFLLLPGHILFPEWFFQAMERMRFITIFSLCAKALTTVLVFSFITEEEDFVLQPLFVSVGYAAIGVVAMYMVLVKWGVRLKRPQWRSMAQAMKSSADVFLNTILPNLYNSFSVVLLGFWAGPAANGIYDAGRKFVHLAQSLTMVMVRAAFPFLSRRMEKHGLFAKLYLSVAAIGALLLFGFSSFLIDVFYTGDFEEAVIVLRITSISVFLVAVSKTYGTSYLIIKGRERALRNATLVCSMFGLCVSVPMVYWLNYVGAAVALVVTQAVLGATLFIQARRVETESQG